MQWETIKGNWRQFQGHAEEYWGKITQDEFAQIEGHRDVLIGKIQAHYGVSEEQAEAQIEEFLAKLRSEQ